jgi:hypothetical protein
MQFHNWPSRSGQHDKSYATAFKVLLITDILVGGDKQIKPSFLSNGQEFAVAEPILSLIPSLGDCVTWEKRNKRCWRAMIKQNAHRAMLTNGFHEPADSVDRDCEPRTRAPQQSARA